MLLAPGCGVVKPMGDGSSGDGTQAQSSASSQKSSETGVGCGKDPTSGVALCVGTTECPKVSLDLDTFPDCGFRTTTGSYDIECVCNGATLCPVGVASSCDDIAALFAHKTLADFCNQSACRDVGPAPGSKPSTRSSSCDSNCAADCAGAATCVQACGC